MGGNFKAFVEWGTDCKYVALGSRCSICEKKIDFFHSGFWSVNSKEKHLRNGILCGKCYRHATSLIERQNEWMSEELRNKEQWRKFGSNVMLYYTSEEIRMLFEQKEISDKERLSAFDSGACGLFRVQEAFVIEAKPLNVGLVRAKKLDGKMVVFGTVEEGIFQKGDKVYIDFAGGKVETVAIEVFDFDPDAFEDSDIYVNFSKTIKANLGYTRKIKENRQGWIILDTELMKVKNGAYVIKTGGRE